MVESTPMVVGGTKKASNSFEVLNLTVVIILIVIVIVTILCLIVSVIFFDRRTVGSLGLINSRKSEKTSVQPSSLHLSFIVEAHNTMLIRLIVIEQACDLRSLIFKQVVHRGFTVDGQSSQSQHVIDLFGTIKCPESQSKRTEVNN